MADKYLIFGAAFNGDGTSSAEASSNGGVGAWNNESILSGTAPDYGVLAAGDTVYIRSKTGNGANANKTFTVTAATTLGSAAATAAAPIVWILDNGDVWPGIDGVLEWDCTSSTPVTMLTIAANNHFIAKTQDAFFADYNLTDPNIRTIVALNDGSYIKNWLIDNNDKTGSYQCDALKFNGDAIAENCRIIYGRLSHQVVVVLGNKNGVLINPKIELVYTAAPAYNTGSVLASLQSSNRGGNLTVYGGTVGGTAASHGFAHLARPGASVYNVNIECYGLQFPKDMPFAQDAASWTKTYAQRLLCMGTDSGYGSAYAEPWGTLDSRNTTYNYPTLNATMPDGASTPWSWRLYAPFASMGTPATLRIGKLYSDVDGEKTVTLEMLTSTDWGAAAVDLAKVWMTVSYVRASDGSLVTETTRLNLPGTALSASSAPWSATSWGAVSLDKRKLSLTTQHAIRQNSMVFVTLFWTPASASANKQVFICPDVQLT